MTAIDSGADAPPQPAVSIVVPVYNGAETIAACLRSLLALRYPREEREIIVVDNGSSDGTPRVLASLDGEIRLLHEPRRGPAAARNRGLAQARGEIVAFTDADCVVDPDWLRHLIVPLADERVGIVGGTIRALPPSSPIEDFGDRIHDHEKAIRDNPPYAITMNWSSRRALLQQLGGFDERLRRTEDVDLAYRCGQAGYRIAFCPDALVYHRNERTLSGLFAEGYLHGFYSVQLLKKHRRFLTGLGHRRVTGTPLKLAAGGMRGYAAGDDRITSACVVAFNGGKQLGKVIGSARFLSLAL